MLYPLKFVPQYQYRIWGGNKLKNILGKEDAPEQTGESWEISAVQDAVSVVANGFLQGNDLQEVIEVYMGDLVGETVYEKFGDEFPLLIKLIDANEVLSVQVHPDDELARARHQAYGKTEMWYIIQADPGSSLFTGFNKKIDKDSYLDHLDKKSIREVLNEEPVAANDVFFIPAGRVHATGSGLLFAEIQQTSDITYRIYDWDRIDKDGEARDLHTDLAIEAIDFELKENYRTEYQAQNNQASNLVQCPFFTTNLLLIDDKTERNHRDLDSFIIYMCLEGETAIHYGGESPETITKGETILVPAEFKQLFLEPVKESRLLEVYLELEPEEEE